MLRLLEMPSGKVLYIRYAFLVEDVYKRQDYVRTKFKLSVEKKNTIQSAMYGPVEDIAP